MIDKQKLEEWYREDFNIVMQNSEGADTIDYVEWLENELIESLNAWDKQIEVRKTITKFKKALDLLEGKVKL